MRVAVVSIAYREANFIGAVIRNWRGKCEKHLVLLSSAPWHGMSLPDDGTKAIAQRLGAEVIELPFASERSQRNWALGYLHDYNYVLQVDADELYEEADQLKILDALGTSAGEWRVDSTNCYRIPKMITYFKSADYVLDPPDLHEPCIAVNPKAITFRDCRIPSTDYQLPIPDVKLHHCTYLRENLRLWHKFKQFEHHDQVRQGWFEDTWMKWTPETENVRAYGKEQSKAIPFDMPKEIRDLLALGLEDAMITGWQNQGSTTPSSLSDSTKASVETPTTTLDSKTLSETP